MQCHQCFGAISTVCLIVVFTTIVTNSHAEKPLSETSIKCVDNRYGPITIEDGCASCEMESDGTTKQFKCLTDIYTSYTDCKEYEDFKSGKRTDYKVEAHCVRIDLCNQYWCGEFTDVFSQQTTTPPNAQGPNQMGPSPMGPNPSSPPKSMSEGKYHLLMCFVLLTLSKLFM